MVMEEVKRRVQLAMADKDVVLQELSQQNAWLVNKVTGLHPEVKFRLAS